MMRGDGGEAMHLDAAGPARELQDLTAIEEEASGDTEDRALRVLWVGPAPWRPDHWGLQTRYALQMFDEPDFTPGVEVRLLASHGFTGAGSTTFEGHRVYGSPYGAGTEAVARALRIAQKHWNPELIVFCGEVQSMPLDAVTWGTPILIWAGPDQTFVPDALLRQYAKALFVAVPTPRGVEMLRARNIDRAVCIPHVVPPAHFAAQTSREARTVLHIGMDDFVFGMVGRNIGTPPRKGFVEALQAFSLIVQQYPQSRLLLWTQVEAPWGGVDLRVVAAELGIGTDVLFAPSEQVLWLDYAEHATIQRIYSAMDVLLAPSYGESFGLPIAEALAVGVPVIAPRHTGMLDWPSDAGWPLLEGYSHRTEQGGYYIKPDSVEIGKLMQEAISTPNIEMAKKWNAGQQWALKNWTAEQAAPLWQSAFVDIKSWIEAQGDEDGE